MKPKYFISFTEEFWPEQRENTWIGRMEYQEEGQHGLFNDEKSITTNNREDVLKLREKYDFKTVNMRTFRRIINTIKALNQD